MIMDDDKDAGRFFQALGDPTRLALIQELRKGERHVTELVRALGCPQPKVSRHLRVLKDAGIVRDQRTGRHVAYTLTTERNWPRAARSWVERLGAGLPLSGAKRAPVLAGVPASAPLRAAATPPNAETPGAAPPPPLRPKKPARPALDAHLL
jgi:DNA-binding transcriptional ArsR family regulator